MDLIIKTGDLSEVIHKITLMDIFQTFSGITTTLCNSSYEALNTDQVVLFEPNIWFKILVLKSITIDCSAQKISCEIEKLGTGKVSSDDTVPLRINPFNKDNSQNSSTASIKHIKVVDEIFSKCRNALKALQRSKTSQFYEDMYRALHDYVLPNVEFGQTDIQYIEKITEELQMTTVVKQDEKIKVKRQDVHDVDELLWNRHKNIIKILLKNCQRNFKINMSCEFAENVRLNLIRQLRKLAVDLNKIQRNVELLSVQEEQLLKDQPENRGQEMKERLVRSVLMKGRSSTGCELQVLSKLYSDKASEIKTELISAKQTLSLMKGQQRDVKSAIAVIEMQLARNLRQGAKNKILSKKEQQSYDELQDLRTFLYNEMKMLIGQKVFQVRAREAAYCEIKELKKKSGHDKKNTKSRQLETVSKELTKVLENPENDITILHYNQLSKIIFCCQIIRSKIDKCSQNMVENPEEQDLNANKNELIMLESEIKSHMEDICKKVQSSAENYLDIHIVWEIYEKLFFENIGSILEATYKAVYTEKVEDFMRCMEKLTPENMGLVDSPVSLLLTGGIDDIHQILTSGSASCRHRTTNRTCRNQSYANSEADNKFSQKELSNLQGKPSKYLPVVEKMASVSANIDMDSGIYTDEPRDSLMRVRQSSVMESVFTTSINSAQCGTQDLQQYERASSKFDEAIEDLGIHRQHGKIPQTGTTCTMKLKPKFSDLFKGVIPLLETLCYDPSRPLSEKAEISYNILQELYVAGKRCFSANIEIDGDLVNELVLVLLSNVDDKLLQSLFINMEMMIAFIPESSKIRVNTAWSKYTSHVHPMWQFLMLKINEFEVSA